MKTTVLNLDAFTLDFELDFELDFLVAEGGLTALGNIGWKYSEMGGMKTLDYFSFSWVWF